MKTYFKDLTIPDLYEIVKKNNELREIAEDLYYNNLMDLQMEETELMLGKHTPGIDIKDHYNSFFFVLNDWEKFFDNLDYQYLNSDNLVLYGEIKQLVEKYHNEEDSDIYSELYEEIEEKCKTLVKGIEDQLHTFEHYSEEDFLEDLRYRLEDGLFSYDGYYIMDNEISPVYLDVTKVFR